MNKWWIAAGVLALVILVFRSTARANEGAGEAWKKIAEGALVIDVRTAGEFSGGHLEGALNIPYEQTGDLIQAIGTNTARSVVLYCRSGRRSGLALNTLVEKGYTNVINAGGYSAIQAAKP